MNTNPLAAAPAERRGLAAAERWRDPSVPAAERVATCCPG